MLVEADAMIRSTLRELEAVPADERQDIGGVDPMIIVLTQSVSICVHRGLLERADAQTREAARIAQSRGHAPSRAWALSLVRWMAFRHGDWAESIRISHETLALAEQLGLKNRLGSGRLLLGRAMVAAGQVDEGTRMLHEGYAMWWADESHSGASELAVIAADVLIEAGRLRDAETFVGAGERAQAEGPERYFAAELARLRARLSQLAGDARAAEAGLYEALAIAERQDARLFALRAATDLAVLLRSRGRAAAGTGVLSDALAAMPEGLEQPDARRARALMQALAPAGTRVA
jgi:hypothetical protein